MKKGIFLTLEGIDGSGKTSALKAVVKLLENNETIKSRFNRIFITREPGGDNNKLAEEIRSILLNRRDLEMDIETEACLFASSRIVHVNKTIIPAIEDNCLVISDRYVDSSIVYQAITNNRDEKQIIDVNCFSINKLMPKKTFLFDLDPEIACSRIKNENREQNRLDEKELEFYNKARNGYLKLANENKDRFVLIDASSDYDSVVQTLAKKILESI